MSGQQGSSLGGPRTCLHVGSGEFILGNRMIHTEYVGGRKFLLLDLPRIGPYYTHGGNAEHEIQPQSGEPAHSDFLQNDERN
jgi:hypothetical protein